MTRSKQIGTAAETAVVRYLESNGWSARRVVLHGAKDQGDIHVDTAGLCTVAVEVKAGRAAETASLEQVKLWWGETEREAVNAGPTARPLLVTKRAGRGVTRVGDWWAWGLSTAPNGYSFLFRCTLADVVGCDAAHPTEPEATALRPTRITPQPRNDQ